MCSHKKWGSCPYSEKGGCCITYHLVSMPDAADLERFKDFKIGDAHDECVDYEVM